MESVGNIILYFIVAIAIIVFSVLTVTTRKILRSATYLLFVLFATARCNVFLMLSMIKIYLVPNTFAALRCKLRAVAHLVVGSVHAGDDNVVVVQTNNLQFCINILFHNSQNLKVQHFPPQLLP